MSGSRINTHTTRLHRIFGKMDRVYSKYSTAGVAKGSLISSSVVVVVVVVVVVCQGSSAVGAGADVEVELVDVRNE